MCQRASCIPALFHALRLRRFVFVFFFTTPDNRKSDSVPLPLKTFSLQLTSLSAASHARDAEGWRVAGVTCEMRDPRCILLSFKCDQSALATIFLQGLLHEFACNKKATLQRSRSQGRAWTMIGQGRAWSVASLPTKTRQELMPM